MAGKKTKRTEKSVAAPAVDRVDWWLAEVGQYGYATDLVDGPHSDREGVEEALYLIRGLGLSRCRKFCCVRVEQSAVDPKPHDTNHAALDDCRSMLKGTGHA